MASKLDPVQSKVYPTIKWDFSEVTDELEDLRLQLAPEMGNEVPNVGRNEKYPLAWILRVPRFTLDLYKLDGTDELEENAAKLLIRRAFKACGVATNAEIAKLAGYANESSVSKWNVFMTTEKVHERVFPALCDAYCAALKEHPNYLSQTFTINDNAFINGTHVPKDEGEARRMQHDIGITRKSIEHEAIWVLLRGELNSAPGIASDTYILMRGLYRRAVALYATLMLSGDELGDLAHVAAALIAQHIAAHGEDPWGTHDNICLSSKRGKLDFTADRYSAVDGGWMPLHAEASVEELASKGEAVTDAALRYASANSLAYIERAARAELERRAKIGGYYLPELDAETMPTDEEGPTT